MSGDPRFLEILDAIRALHIKKASDYGAGEDPLANLRATAEFGIQPWIGCMVRLRDKVTRVASLIANGKLENESVLDSFRDIAAYAILAEVLYTEKKDDPQSQGRLQSDE